MIIYLDESGDLGFNFAHEKTSRYLVITLLICKDDDTHLSIIQAIRRTLRNKLPKYISELKGSNLSLSIKKYFLREVDKKANWYLCTAIADKKAWANHRISIYHQKSEKIFLYDELAKRLFSQIDYSESMQCINIIVDRSKKKDEIIIFNKIILAAILEKITIKTFISIKHRNSQEDAGLQAVDLFCAGVGKKYEKSDVTWYSQFAKRISIETIYKS